MIDAGLIVDNASEFLLRVQRYSYQYRTTVMHDNNDVDEMESLLASRFYHDGIADSTAFAFGYTANPTGQPALTIGSPERPLVIGFSSKRLLRNLAHAEHHVLHVDATFKLNTSSFPAIVIDVSDLRRQFHPVAFFITSDLKHTQVESVIRATLRQHQAVTGNIAKFSYVMADADSAQRNAIELVVLQELGVMAQPTYLMCFFHVMQNVKKYLSAVTDDARKIVFKHVYCIHYSRTQQDLLERIETAISTWKDNPACCDFERRFTEQWLRGRFTQWQCLSSPTGFAKTNNPVEQFNKEIKRDYSLRSVVSVNSLAQAFLDMCHHRSARAKPFEIAPHASIEQGRRYRALMAANRLAVTSWYRSSILFMTEGSDCRIFRVFQSGFDITKTKKTASAIVNKESNHAALAMEVEGQPTLGWLVDVDAQNFTGMPTKRKFYARGKKKAKGRPTCVGHALSHA